MGNILDVCSELTIGNNQDTLLKIPFIGRGNIWIDNVYDDSVIALAQHIIYEAVQRTAPGQLSIIGYDSDLSGVFAPFATLSSGEYKLLELISDDKDLKIYLDYVWQQIHAVQNVIQGRRRALIDFRNETGQPVESYKLVVLSLDMGLIDNDIRYKMALMMRNGPSCGVSFLIISTTFMSIQSPGNKEIVLTIDSLAPNISVLHPSSNAVSVDGTNRSFRWQHYNAEKIITECATFAANIKNAKLPTVPFDELHDLTKMWDRDSAEGLTFSIGKYGINDVEITIGDEINQRHNAVITGAVGQGKSNLISVIIHSLCLRYSPRELQLYLLDFKEGVTFKAFSNIGQDEYLPHARALGLESDVSFGLAVLESLFAEYQSRMRMLKDHNLRSISEYRRKFPHNEMPRIVVVIDEFQMMFGEDMSVGQKIADLLEKSVRLFRAAGIHFILASQTLSGNMALAYKKDSIFAQIPIRIALKNSLIESQQTLSLNNSAAAFLKPREAIVNLDYGEISQNKKSIVAYADEMVLTGVRKVWWEKSRTNYSAPYVFESNKRITVSRSISFLYQARKSQSAPAAVVGEKISVDGFPLALPLPNEPGRNIAIIGSCDSDCNQALGMFESIAISLALQHPKGDARFLFYDFTDEKTLMDNKYPQFAQLMENNGFFIECRSVDAFEETLKTMLAEANSSETIYVFGLGLDKWKHESDPYSAASSLKTFVESAPSQHMHFIGWWTKASAFTSQVAGFGNTDAFNSKIFMRIDERAVQSLTTPFVRWTAQSNRGLLSDAVEYSEEIVFVPYAPVTTDDINRFKSTMWN